MFRRDLFSIFLVVLISVLSAAEFPSDVKRCKSDDTECQKNVLQEIIEKFHSKGHPGLNLVPFDPFEVKSLVIPRYSRLLVNVALEFKKITLNGISNVNVQKISGLKEDGPNKFKYELEGNFPHIEITGPYSVDGKVVFSSITGSGQSKIIFDDVNAKITGELSIVERNGKKYLNVDEVHIDLNPKNAKFYFDNISGAINSVINYDWSSIYNEIKAPIMNDLGKILISIINPVLSSIEYSEVFLPA